MHHVEFDSGLTVLRVPSPRSAVVPELVCARLVDERGPVHWIDARNAARTHALYDCAPSSATLEPLRVARAFTAYQHHALIRRVTREATSRSSLVVVPNGTSLYRDDDLDAFERETLLASALSALRELGNALEIPVLLTTAAADVPAVLDDHADHAIECVRTRAGTRLEGDGVESVGYWDRHGWQTTIPYWVECCGAVEAFDPAVAAHDRGLLAPELTRGWEPPSTDEPAGPRTQPIPVADGGNP